MTSPETLRSRTFERWEDLPEPYLRLVEAADKRSFLQSPAWYRAFCEANGGKFHPRLYGLETLDGRARALLPMRRSDDEHRLPGRRQLRSLTNLYSIGFGPILGSDEADLGAVGRAFATALARDTIRWTRLEFEALDHESDFFKSLSRGLQSEHYLVHPYFQFANWHEGIDHRAFEAFWASRPSQLRHLVARRSRRLIRANNPRFEILFGTNDVRKAIDSYEQVYRRSWKPPEPFPRFVPRLIQEAASANVLRLGFLYTGDKLIAAQIWIVSDKRATIFKLAHDRTYQFLSPGTLLTHHLLRHSLENDDVSEVDFGRGDEPFKQLWLQQRREKWGLLAFHRSTPVALLEATRHIGARKLRDLQRRLRQAN